MPQNRIIINDTLVEIQAFNGGRAEITIREASGRLSTLVILSEADAFSFTENLHEALKCAGLEEH